MERYSNTQRGVIRPLLAGMGIICLFVAYFYRIEFLLVALLLYALSFVFGQLKVEDRGEFLLVSFGPLPLIRRKIRYADIASAELYPGGLLKDGWGVHWTSKGWSWNVGGSCRVRFLFKRGGAFIVGSDDDEGLLDHINAKLKSMELLKSAAPLPSNGSQSQPEA